MFVVIVTALAITTGLLVTQGQRNNVVSGDDNDPMLAECDDHAHYKMPTIPNLPFMLLQCPIRRVEHDDAILERGRRV